MSNVLNNGTMHTTNDKKIHFICKVDKEVYKCIAGEIQTNEFIITEERINHISVGKGRPFEIMKIYLASTLQNPDYILADKKNRKTAWVLKEFYSSEVKLKLVIRVQTMGSNPNLKNSIITGMFINEKKWRQYINNRKVLYKSKRMG